MGYGVHPMVTGFVEWKRQSMSAKGQVEIAVEHHRSGGVSGVEWFLSVEVEVAVQIDAVSCECVVGALHVAVVVEYSPCAIERR